MAGLATCSCLLSLGPATKASVRLSGHGGSSACNASRLLTSAPSQDLGQGQLVGPSPGVLGAIAPGGRGA
eukprot:2041286-Alexandrium_andersonii.AAC.1